MLYQLYDLQRAAWAPVALAAEAAWRAADVLLPPAGALHLGRAARAACEILSRTARSHRHADFDIASVVIGDEEVAIEERVVAELPFCSLRHFARDSARQDPKLLVVAPLSGHFAALLNDALKGLLETHDVYVSDWHDAREVPLAAGPFDLDSYIAYLIGFMRLLGPELHIVAFSQATVPALAASAILAQAGDAAEPRTLTLVGGPIDARVNATPAQRLCERQPRAFYETAVLATVPHLYPGAGRRVLPGFVQLAGYISHNFGRHLEAHWDFFGRIMGGDHAGAEAHRRFYDRFYSVLDLPAEFFLDTIETVFQQQRLARGTMSWRELSIEPRALRRTSLLTIEGELDDVSPPGQTEAAHALCSALPAERRGRHLEPAAGHLALFSGQHWRNAILPRLATFIRSQQSLAT